MPDEDSEPILGHWLEETLSPDESSANVPSGPSLDVPENLSPIPKHTSGKSGINDSGFPCFVPDKKDPDGVSNGLMCE